MSPRPLKVLQFTEGTSRYGAAVSMLNLVDSLLERQLDVHFAVFRGRELSDLIRERAIPLHEIPARKRFDLRGIRACTRLLKEEQFDVVHTHLSRATLIGSVAAKLARVPSVATVHGMNKKYTYMLADHVITVSEAARQHLLKQGMAADRVTAVYNGLRLEPFENRPDKLEAKRAVGLAPDDLVLGTVSRADYGKGIQDALAAVKGLRDAGVNAKYVMVGDGRHHVQLQELAVEMGLKAHTVFAGFQDNVVPWLAAFDIFLFPTRQEAFGISLLEAMAAEIPIVASPVDGVPEVLDGESALYVEPRHPEEIVNQCLRLIRDEELRQTLVSRALARVRERFSMEASARAVDDVYRLAMKRQPGPKRITSRVL